MNFDSLQYLIFLPAVALVYRLTPGKWRWIPLLAASYGFYMQWNAALSLLILGVTAVSWGASLLVEKARTQGGKRLILAANMVICLGLLGYFKYFGFLMESLQTLSRFLGGTGPWRTWDILLPVGVSFFTFQAMSSVVDVCRGDMAAERHFGYYALYVSFFPQLVAGPIERATRLLPQLRAHRDPTADDLRMGLRLLLTGMFRKVAVADFAARFVERIYALPEPDGAAVTAATILFALQIYCDFAGYSEIAAGSARLMGVRLMRNFDRPYGAATIREFWRRWHISLSTWFTDYVYIPLGGSRRGLARQILATLTVFALSGLWHGAAWTFVVWGLLHGLMMTGQILLTRGKRLPTTGWQRALMTGATFAAVCLTWVFFRAESMGHAWMLLGRVFSAWDVAAAVAQLGMTWPDGVQLAATLALFPVLHSLSLERQDGGPLRPARDMTLTLLAAAIALAWVIRLENNLVSAFIYFQF